MWGTTVTEDTQEDKAPGLIYFNCLKQTFPYSSQIWKAKCDRYHIYYRYKGLQNCKNVAGKIVMQIYGTQEKISEFGKYSSNPTWETITCFSHPWKCEIQWAIISSFEGLIVWEISLIKNSLGRETERETWCDICRERKYTHQQTRKEKHTKEDVWFLILTKI